MKNYFLQQYVASSNSIPGYFLFDAALMFLAYNQLVAAQGVTGDVLEIGVHHGLSAIIVASMAGRGRKFIAVDLFEELQDHNVSGSGSGNEKGFLSNMQKFFNDLSFLQTIKANSASLSAEVLGSEFAFCHIDGGHTPDETYKDLDLCCRVLMPGGLLALDDYFNPAFPGVCEGANQFRLEQRDKLTPVAIGFNKVLFQRTGSSSDLDSSFKSRFPMIPTDRSVLWGTPVNHFTTKLRPFFDLTRSSPHSLVATQDGIVTATFEMDPSSLRSEPDKTISLEVKITNQSESEFPYGDGEFGLSYHLLSKSRKMIMFDNVRSYLQLPLQPGRSVSVSLPIQVPSARGEYQVELDLVWEGMLWFKENGNPTAKIDLVVI
jgi:predicted O-methyltransferase YrrM